MSNYISAAQKGYLILECQVSVSSYFHGKEKVYGSIP
jgi:hypothetical protein